MVKFINTFGVVNILRCIRTIKEMVSITIGIYKIENAKTKKVYIGSSNNIESRFKQHIKMLESNKHHSVKLQRSYNKTIDKSVFKFSVIEELESTSGLLEVEQEYIIKYDSLNNGYNCNMPLEPHKSIKRIGKKKRQNDVLEYFKEYTELICELGDRYIGIIRKTPKLKMKKLNELLRYFIDNFDILSHYARLFQVTGTKEYLEVMDNNKEVIGVYAHVKDKIQLHEEYTESSKKIHNKK